MPVRLPIRIKMFFNACIQIYKLDPTLPGLYLPSVWKARWTEGPPTSEVNALPAAARDTGALQVLTMGKNKHER